MDTPTKRCTKCGREFPATMEFFKIDKRKLSGLGAQCKACHNAERNQYRKDHHAEVLEKHRQYNTNNRDKLRQYYTLHKAEIIEKQREYNRQRYRLNIGKFAEQRLRWRKNNPERTRELDRRWSKNNPDKARIKNQRRSARKRLLPHTFTLADHDYAWTYFHGCCAYCGHTPSLFDLHSVLHEEHFVAQSKDGGYTSDNILPACESCNLDKSDQDPHEWAVKRFGKKRGNIILQRIANFFASVQKD